LANEERMKTPPPLADTTAKDTLPDPNQTTEAYLEILPDAGQTTEKVITPEGDVVEISFAYTLSEEGEGDNISGNKELWNDAENEDETSSKRPKVPLLPETTE